MMGPKGEMVSTSFFKSIVPFIYATLVLEFIVIYQNVFRQIILILFSGREPEVLMEIQVPRVLQGQL